MEPTRFDTLVRTLAIRPTRRAVLVALGASLTRLLTGTEAAAQRRPHHRCRRLGRVCIPERGLTCCGGTTCQEGRCQCPRGKRRCGSTCIAARRCCRNRCPGGQVCRQGRCVPPPPPACGDGGPCRVFTTSTDHTGNLGGLAGADAICQSLAENANLPGTYLAWLSDSATSPSERFTRSTGPYQLVDGTQIAASWAALTSGEPEHPINLTEAGDRVPFTRRYVWTKTLPDGTFNPRSTTCNDWQGTADLSTGGIATETDRGRWTNGFNGLMCSETCALYCFQQA